MSGIKDTDYITVKRGQDGKIGVFVGGKPATTYRGQEIYDIDYVKRVFKWMEKQQPNIAEFQIMSSKTWGKYAETGNPSAEHGPNAWCRIVLNDSSAAPWVCSHMYLFATVCAHLCAAQCANDVHGYAPFRLSLLGFAAKQPKVIGPKEVVEKQIRPNQM